MNGRLRDSSSGGERSKRLPKFFHAISFRAALAITRSVWIASWYRVAATRSPGSDSLILDG